MYEKGTELNWDYGPYCQKNIPQGTIITYYPNDHEISQGFYKKGVLNCHEDYTLERHVNLRHVPGVPGATYNGGHYMLLAGPDTPVLP